VVVDENLNEPEFHVSDHLPPCAGPLPAAPLGRASGRYLQFSSQAHDALAQLIRQVQDEGGPVLAVTHGGVIKTLLRLVSGSDLVTFRLYNTAITLIEWQHGRWNLVFLNLWDHLTVELRTR
jgi:probable phosphoglycerate mutase